MPGWNIDVKMKWGVDNSLGSAIDWKRVFGEDVFIQTTMGELGVWYNFYFDKHSGKGFALTAGGLLDMRSSKIAINSSAFNSRYASSDNADVIYKYFFSVSYRL